MQPDAWQFLQNYTPARIARGRTGHSLPTVELLKFQADHAQARDAVYSELAISELTTSIRKVFDLHVFNFKSEIKNRTQYLQRPDLGRTLSSQSKEELMGINCSESDICFVIADGLSAQAVNQNALPILENLIPKIKEINWKIAPICIVEQGRVAIGDEIGFLLKSEIIVIFIGERPGLTSPDSMGTYISFRPYVGMTDENRNCVSNIRPDGMNINLATEKILYLLTEIKTKKLSGVTLKDEYKTNLPLNK